ncbi:MAG: 16S rRNA (cytosine(967)-C(5))-methyltransferase RsmB [Candidatus Neomarinimicrobiota bacterium]
MKSREATLDILDQAWQRNKRLSDIRDAYFKTHSLPVNIRQRITSMTQEITRWQGRLDYWLGQVSHRPLTDLQRRLLILLRIGAYEILLDDQIPDYAAINSAVDLARRRVGRQATGLVNATLRNVAKLDPLAPPSDPDHHTTEADWYSFPRWLWGRWIDRYGPEDTRALGGYLNSFPALTIRRDRGRIDSEKLVQILAGDGILVEPLPGTDLFFQVRTGGAALRTHQLFKTGCIAFQDRAAGAVVELLDPQPGEIILDLCAAPGTKTVYIAELLGRSGDGWIHASDSDRERVTKARRDGARHGWRNIHWNVADATVASFPLADGILVDAPCSGTGVIGRRPDIRWRRVPADLVELAELQLNILTNSARYLKPGGRLVYATCTLEPEENWNVVKAFLKLQRDFTVAEIDHLVPKEWIGSVGCLETFPPRDQVDGIFAARLKKI